MKLLSNILARTIILLRLATAWPGPDRLADDACQKLMEAGDCSKEGRKVWMRTNCPASCRTYQAMGIAQIDFSKRQDTFFDLKANDSKGRSIDFERFAGYVTIIVDESSLCGFTKKEVKELERLQKAHEYVMQIVIFPTHQITGGSVSDDTTTETTSSSTKDDCPGLKDLKKSNGANFLFMEPVEVNGVNTHPVYQYLKGVQMFEDLGTDYVTYFVIQPEGHVQVHEDITPLALMESVIYAVRTEL